MRDRTAMLDGAGDVRLDAFKRTALGSAGWNWLANAIAMRRGKYWGDPGCEQGGRWELLDVPVADPEATVRQILTEALDLGIEKGALLGYELHTSAPNAESVRAWGHVVGAQGDEHDFDELIPIVGA